MTNGWVPSAGISGKWPETSLSDESVCCLSCHLLKKYVAGAE
jgi:hypothetical protein